MDPDAVRVTGLAGRLEFLVRSTPWLLEALRAAREVDLAFDPTRLDQARDAEIETALTDRLPGMQRQALEPGPPEGESSQRRVAVLADVHQPGRVAR